MRSDTLDGSPPRACGIPDNSQWLVLVVDDNPDLREILVEALEFVGFRTASAADGVEALAAIKRLRPDVVLMDLALPRMGGIEVTRVLKASPKTRTIPIIAVSEFPDDVLKIALSAGCAAALRKPVELDGLVREIRRVLAPGNWPVT